MPSTISPTSRQRGFTLVELIITLVLVAILGTFGSSMISDSFRTSRMVNSNQANSQQAAYALERLAREIREVKYIDLATGYAISSTLSTSATNMVFVRDIGGADVTVTINLSGNNLTLGYSSPAATSTVASQVTAFTLSFLKADGSATTVVTDVRFVVIDLTATDATSGQPIQERLRVALRNT